MLYGGVLIFVFVCYLLYAKIYSISIK